MKNLFSGLENLGFKNITDELYENETKAASKAAKLKVKKEVTPLELIYDKSFKCPVCGSDFKNPSVKTGRARLISKDTDLMPKYEPINPLFYDVVLCPKCGYAAMSKYFDKIKQSQASLVREKISPRYIAKSYPTIYDVDTAIERYKLSLLNSLVKNGKTSEKAYTCLKIAWLYRIKEDNSEEVKFLEQAFQGFKDAYVKESFPICSMDSYTLMYLLGELSRRLNNTDEALKWLSQVIVSPNVNPRLKELARDQKDLIRNK